MVASLTAALSLLFVNRSHSAPRSRPVAQASSDGPASIVCCSPLDAVAAAAQWLTSVPGVPLSRLQAMCLLTCNGCSDPWLEVGVNPLPPHFHPPA